MRAASGTTRRRRTRAWAWRWPVPEGDRATFAVTRREAPAAALFDELHAGLAVVRACTSAAPRYDLVAWLGQETRWGCGACFWEMEPRTRLGQRFDAKIWIDGGSDDQLYWSSAVTLHELGHYVMAAWGTSPHEGGAHFLGVPTTPGMAWSEGWANWVSADLRDDPRIYAVGFGTFYWWDIRARTYYDGTPWVCPTATRSILQSLDENEVSAILWLLSRPDPTGLYRALVSPRMTIPVFARCYTRHTPDPLDVSRQCASGELVLHLADMLDALRCSGVSASSVRAAIGPYPYDVASPRCSPGAAGTNCPAEPLCRASHRLAPPVVAAWVERAALGAQHDLLARVTQPGDLGVPAALELPPGVVLRAGPASWTLAPHESRDDAATVEVPSGLDAPVVLRA